MKKKIILIVVLLSTLLMVGLMLFLVLGNNSGLLNLFKKGGFSYYNEWEIIEAPNATLPDADEMIAGVGLNRSVTFDQQSKTINIDCYKLKLSINFNKIVTDKKDESVLKHDTFKCDNDLEFDVKVYSNNIIIISNLDQFSTEWENTSYIVLRKKDATKEELLTKNMNPSITNGIPMYMESTKTYVVAKDTNKKYVIYEATDQIIAYSLITETEIMFTKND